MKVLNSFILPTLVTLGIGGRLFGADLPNLDLPVTHGIDFDYFPFVIVGAGTAIGIVWSRRRNKLDAHGTEPMAAHMSRRKSRGA